MKLNKLFAIGALALLPVAATAAPVTVYEADGIGYVDDLDPTYVTFDFFDDDLNMLDVSLSAVLDAGVFSATLTVSDFDTGLLLESSSVLSYDAEINDPLTDGTKTLDSATITFDALSGPSMGLFAGTAQVVFSFYEEDSAFGEYTGVNAKVLSTLAPVPLPATLPLLGLGLGLGAFVARRGSRRG